MNKPETVVVVTHEDLYAAMTEMEETGSVEWTDREGNAVRLVLPMETEEEQA